MSSHSSFPRRLAVTLRACVLTALGAGALSAQRTYSSLTMFGDSFSDVGNAAALTAGAAPARFSNGDVWSDHLASRLGRSGDATPAFLSASASGVYAVGGALTAPGTATGTATQIGRWCLFTAGACTRAADPTGLYTLFAGGNDVRLAATLGTDAARRAATVTAAQNLVGQAQSLFMTGARSILFAYLPDLGLTPDRITTPASSTLSELTRLFNATLETGINQLRLGAPSATFFDLRLDNLFANLVARPAQFGFTNTSGSCIAAGQLPTCTGYVFWDGLHPTAAAHELAGIAAYNLVAYNQNVGVVPEPSTVVLLGSGVVMLAGAVRVRRRRQRVGGVAASRSADSSF